MSDERARLEQLVLKAAFGGTLDETEDASCRRFLATAEGRAYEEGVVQTRRFLQSTPSREERTPLSAERIAHLRARFVTTHRLNAHQRRRRFLGLLLGAFGFATAGALLGHLLGPLRARPPTPEDLRNLWILLYGAAGLFSAFMFFRLRELEHAPDLFDRLTRRERRQPHALGAMLRTLPLVAALTFLGARGRGWGHALLWVPLAWIVLAVGAHVLRAWMRRTRMDRDPELWSWWYGDETQGRPPA